MQGAVKVASDFISQVNLPASVGLIRELRAARLATRKADVLQLFTSLWVKWQATELMGHVVEEPEERRSPDPSDDPAKRPWPVGGTPQRDKYTPVAAMASPAVEVSACITKES